MAKTADKSKVQLLLGADINANVEFTPSQRLKDLGVTVTLRPLDDEGVKIARTAAEDGKGNIVDEKLAIKAIELALVDPSPQELFEATGALTQELALKRVFNVGERASMSAHIMKISGFAPIQEEVDELKN